MFEVARHQATPQREVNQRGGLRCFQLKIEALCIESRRRGIERHLNIAGRAPCRQCRRARGETFPRGTPWLIEMYMRINHARKHMESLGVDFLFACACKIESESDNVPTGNSDIDAAFACWSHHRTIAHKQVILAHSYLLLQRGA